MQEIVTLCDYVTSAVPKSSDDQVIHHESGINAIAQCTALHLATVAQHALTLHCAPSDVGILGLPFSRRLADNQRRCTDVL